MSTLNEAKNVVILAGAGMSAGLGIPVYWTAGGKYGDQRTAYGYTALEHAHASMYKKDPKAQYRYHAEQSKTLLSVNVAGSHYQRLLEYVADKNYVVMTTNIDHAFVRSGFDPTKVTDVHGSYAVWQCSHDGLHGLWLPYRFQVCPVCSNIARPNVMFFDDPTYVLSVERAQAFNHYADFASSAQPEDTVVLEIGVGMTVPRLLHQSADWASRGFDVFRINPDGNNPFDFYSVEQYLKAEEFCNTLPV